MADLTDLQASLPVKIIGSDSTGNETNAVNATANGLMVDGSAVVQPVSIASNIGVTDGAKGGGLYGNIQLTVSGTPVEAKVGTNRLTGRRSLYIFAVDKDVYWGTDASVTTSTGLPLYKQQFIQFPVDADGTFRVYLVTASATANVRVAELL